MYFVDPDDGEFLETIKKCSEKFEVPMEAETERPGREPHSSPKTKNACFVEAHESIRERLESSLPTDQEDHIAGEGYTSMTHYKWVHKFIPMPQAMKIPDAKAAVDKAWKKLETISAWQLGKVKSKKEIISGSTKRQKRKSTLLH